LILVLTATGTFGNGDTLTWKKWLFIVIAGLAVFTFGWLAHPVRGKHLLIVALIGLVLIGATLITVFGWDWHGTSGQREQLREGLFEVAAVVLVGFASTAAGLVYYAKNVLRPYKSADDIPPRIVALEDGTPSSGDTDRHEFIGAILRAIGASDSLGPIFEYEEPPMLKSFLEVEVSARKVTFTAYRASGFEVEADNPAVVDRFEVALPSE
jgi:hypothetical protein